MLIVGLFYALWLGILAFLMFKISVLNAYIFINMYPLFYFIQKFIMDKKCYKKEYIGSYFLLIVGFIISINHKE
jgi:hypothetical protein